jgi:hypothetical protein
VAYVPPKGAFVHTNHCLAPHIGEVSGIAPTSTTHERYGWMMGSVLEHPLSTRKDLWERLGSHEGHPHSICTHLNTPELPHGVATCAGALMDLATPELWAQAGCLHGRQPERASFPAAGA